MSSAKKRREIRRAHQQVQSERLAAGTARGEAAIWKAGAEIMQQRITALEAGLREAREALIPYMKLVDGTQVKNQAAQCYDKIDKLLCTN